ncbi:MAG: universal stress protein [Anaerolineales bacterium]|nr:universal stress protein [Anaerolineales bacterium]
MFKKILIPLDGSELAERSLVLADGLVHERDAEMLLLRVPVLYDDGAATEVQPTAWDHSEAEAYLKKIQARREHPRLTIRTQVIAGDAAQVIVDTAVSEAVDLLVMSTHGRSGFGRSILGSVAERVLRSAPCGMLVARSKQPMRKLLITLDGSPLSERVLAPGLEVAQRFGAQVTLLRVCVGSAGRTQQQQQLQVNGRLNPDLESRLAMDARTYLDCLVEREKLAGKVETIVLQGPVAPTIIDYVADEQFDMVSMATHGFSAQIDMPYGQITEKVMRWADASLFIVRPE